MASRQEPADDVKVRTLPGQVAAHLVRRIMQNPRPDGLAPSEIEICTEFGVSRAVARESLKILASLDMVQIAQGRRVTVRPQAEWDYLNPLLAEWLPAADVRQLLRELHETRLLLEPELAAKAATVATDETLAGLQERVDRMAGLEDAPEEYLAIDLGFHMEICRAADNRILDRIMYSARWLLTASRRITNEGPQSLHSATSDHRRILRALAAHDPDRARKAMRSHLQRTYPILDRR